MGSGDACALNAAIASASEEELKLVIGQLTTAQRQRLVESLPAASMTTAADEKQQRLDQGRGHSQATLKPFCHANEGFEGFQQNRSEALHGFQIEQIVHATSTLTSGGIVFAEPGDCARVVGPHISTDAFPRLQVQFAVRRDGRSCNVNVLLDQVVGGFAAGDRVTLLDLHMAHKISGKVSVGDVGSVVHGNSPRKDLAIFVDFSTGTAWVKLSGLQAESKDSGMLVHAGSQDAVIDGDAEFSDPVVFSGARTSSLDGTWITEAGDRIEIQASKISWGGTTDVATITQRHESSWMFILHGIEHEGVLQVDRKLHWSDGDIWKRDVAFTNENNISRFDDILMSEAFVARALESAGYCITCHVHKQGKAGSHGRWQVNIVQDLRHGITDLSKKNFEVHQGYAKNDAKRGRTATIVRGPEEIAFVLQRACQTELARQIECVRRNDSE